MSDSKKAFIRKLRAGYTVKLLKSVGTVAGISIVLELVAGAGWITLPAHSFFTACGLIVVRDIIDRIKDIVGAGKLVDDLNLTFVSEDEAKEMMNGKDEESK